METMLGWLSFATAWASVIKREYASSLVTALLSILTATTRFNTVSLALYTIPFPPSPSFFNRAYRPFCRYSTEVKIFSPYRLFNRILFNPRSYDFWKNLRFDFH